MRPYAASRPRRRPAGHTRPDRARGRCGRPEQSVLVDQPEAPPRLGLERPSARALRAGSRPRRCRPSRRRGRRSAGRAAAAGHADRRRGCAPSATAAVPWMSSLKVQQLVAVALEERAGVRLAKSSHCRQTLGSSCLTAWTNASMKSSYSWPGDALVAPAEVHRDRRGAPGCSCRRRARSAASGRVDTADERVQRELADGDAQAADALVADAEDALAVGDDDHVDLGVRAGCAASVADVGPVRVRDEQAARAAVDVAELLARQRRPSACRRSAASRRRGRAAAGRRAPRSCPAGRAGKRAARGRRPGGCRPRRRARPARRASRRGAAADPGARAACAPPR